MNRCDIRSPARAWRPPAALAAAALALATAGQVLAQTTLRHFPDKAIRATMVVKAPPEITMDGTPMRLSPGARIRGTTNTLVLSGTLVGQPLTVNYVTDMQGLVHEVWILTEAEAAEKRARLGSQHNYSTLGDSPR